MREERICSIPCLLLTSSPEERGEKVVVDPKRKEKGIKQQNQQEGKRERERHLPSILLDHRIFPGSCSVHVFERIPCSSSSFSAFLLMVSLSNSLPFLSSLFFSFKRYFTFISLCIRCRLAFSSFLFFKSLLSLLFFFFHRLFFTCYGLNHHFFLFTHIILIPSRITLYAQSSSSFFSSIFSLDSRPTSSSFYPSPLLISFFLIIFFFSILYCIPPSSHASYSFY